MTDNAWIMFDNHASLKQISTIRIRHIRRIRTQSEDGDCVEISRVPVLSAHGKRLLREDVLLVGLAERALLQVERLPQLDVHRRVAAARSELWKRAI